VPPSRLDLPGPELSCRRFGAFSELTLSLVGPSLIDSNRLADKDFHLLFHRDLTASWSVGKTAVNVGFSARRTALRAQVLYATCKSLTEMKQRDAVRASRVHKTIGSLN